MTLSDANKYILQRKGKMPKYFLYQRNFSIFRWTYTQLCVTDFELTYCLQEVIDNQAWIVYSQERSVIRFARLHLSLDEAVEDFLHVLKDYKLIQE